MMVLSDCARCEGSSVILTGVDCGKTCPDCRGLGIVQRPVSDDEADEVFFNSLPPGWTRDHARALLSRMRTGRPVVLPEVVWSHYPDGRP